MIWAVVIENIYKRVIGSLNEPFASKTDRHSLASVIITENCCQEHADTNWLAFATFR